ncbi:MAG TPA: response regulator [Armatimonadota bacterium]|nr:response regulator [Armatimonadota bacterium]
MDIGKQKVLLVDDCDMQRRAYVISLKRPGRAFLEAEDGDVAIAIAAEEKPDIILTDYHMPNVDGIELVQRIRKNPFTAHIPVIMVSGESDPDERVMMIRAGCDDVVLKPYNPLELAARVDMVIARCDRELSTDSLTRLPGNEPTRTQIARRIKRGSDFSLCYIDIDNFKAYVDRYGYERGSRAIASMARLIERSVRDTGMPSDFVGHIGGDDFITLAAPDRARTICDRVLKLFCERRAGYYDDEDAQRGCITAHSRDGELRDWPLMTLSIVIIHCSDLPDCSTAILADLAARLKAEAKSVEGSLVMEYGCD